MGFIYLITNKENGKQYVGKTSYTVGLRWQDHKKNFRRILDNMAIHKAMNKYGPDSFEITQLEECQDYELNAREQYWIKQYDTYNNGYNLTLGGDGAPRYDREKIQSMWTNGKTIEDIEKEIGADRHTICNILKLCGIETIDFKRRSGGRAVLQYSVDGQFIARYESLTMAAEAMGRDNVSNIRSCCNKTSTSAYNYLWKYEDDDTLIDEFVSRQKKTGKGAVKMVEQYSLDGEYIQTFSSCREAARSIGAPYHVGINSCCLGKQKIAYGFKWKYAGEV
jgi:group I intron endonuclease